METTSTGKRWVHIVVLIFSALLIHQQQRMNKLKEDIEKKRQILGQLRKDVSGSEKSKHVESNFRTSFPTVSGGIAFGFYFPFIVCV